MLRPREILKMMNRGLKSIHVDNKKCSMMEFGSIGIDVKGVKEKIAKKYFKSLGMRHVSIDLDGRWGSLKLNLGKPILKFKGEFDIVTDFGTCEHVYNQYECFKNMHNFCKPGGMMIHVVPMPNNWVGHCEFHYDDKFFIKLSELCKYEILESMVMNMAGGPPRMKGNRRLICVSLKKTIDNKFTSPESFKKVPVTIEKYNAKNVNNLRFKK